MLDPGPKFNPFKPYFDGFIYIDLPQPHDNRLRDSEYIYRYFDGKRERVTRDCRIREATARIRKTSKPLHATSPMANTCAGKDKE